MGCYNLMCKAMMDTQDVFYNPSAPPGFMTSASTWLALHTYQYIALIYMYVNVQHGILYNTDMHHTDDYMVVWECMYIYICTSHSKS